MREGQPSAVGCADARARNPGGQAFALVGGRRFGRLGFLRFAFGQFAIGRLAVGRFATARFAIGRLASVDYARPTFCARSIFFRAICETGWSARSASSPWNSAVSRDRLLGFPFRAVETASNQHPSGARSPVKTLSETGLPFTLASCHFVSPGTTANTSSGLTPGSSAGLGFSTFATLGFDFAGEERAFVAERSALRRLPERQRNSRPSPRRRLRRVVVTSREKGDRRGTQQDSQTIRSIVVSHEVPSREERVRLAQARLCGAISGEMIVFVSTRTGPTGTLLVRKPSSEILDDFAQADQPFGAVAVFVAGCQPPRANLLFERFGHASVRREADDLAAGTMDVSAASADALQRLLQQVDGAAVVPPGADRDVEILVDHAGAQDAADALAADQEVGDFADGLRAAGLGQQAQGRVVEQVAFPAGPGRGR